jgi:hypothetical protein
MAPVHFEDAPLAVLADQEIGLAVVAVAHWAEASLAIGEKQYSSLIQRPRDAYLNLGPEAQSVPLRPLMPASPLIAAVFSSRHLRPIGWGLVGGHRCALDGR